MSLALLVHLNFQSSAQLIMSPTSHDFGQLGVSGPNWVDVKLTNNGKKEVVIFRVECPDHVVVEMSSKIIPPDSAAYIRLLYNPVHKGSFREMFSIFTSAWERPELFSISGESTFVSESFSACPNFEALPGGTPKQIYVAVSGSSASNSLEGVELDVYQNGRIHSSTRTNVDGEALLNLVPGRYFFVFKNKTHELDSAIYIHGWNQRLILSIHDDIEPSVGDDIDHSENARKAENIESVSTPVFDGIDNLMPSSDSDSGLLGKEFRPVNIVFLVDVSSSMQHGEKLELLKIAMTGLLDVLRPGDKFTLISYANDSKVLIETNAFLNKSACGSAIANLQAGGGTEGAKAIDIAGKKVLEHMIEGGHNQLVIATDGAFKEGGAQAKRLSRHYQRNGVLTSVLGIKCSKAGYIEMSAVAEAGGGRFIAINNVQDAGQSMVDEIKSSSRK